MHIAIGIEEEAAGELVVVDHDVGEDDPYDPPLCRVTLAGRIGETPTTKSPLGRPRPALQT